ncbi:hypothetical protein [Nocardioides marmoriginsengisoli]|nr:hypothetical protein [Nocardioides marmoriginsengisoli]
MTASPRPHGPLPARVYWFRRALVLGTALALVFALARMLTGSAEPDPQSKANVTAAKSTPTPEAGPLGPQPVVTAKPGATPTGTPPPALAQPSGPCALDEITVTPVVGTLQGGGTVPLTLQLTGIRPACNFEVTADSVVAKVTAGKKRVWSSQDCPSSIKKAAVVVRSGAPTTIQVTWNGRYSDAQCSRSTDWAMPGSYQVLAAVIGSEPTSAPFRMTSPPRPVITVTPKPKNKPKGKASKSPTVASGR